MGAGAFNDCSPDERSEIRGLHYFPFPDFASLIQVRMSYCFGNLALKA
jgi:hypothetical protein